MKLRWLRMRLPNLALAYILCAVAGSMVFGWPWWVPGVPGLLLVAMVVVGVARPASSLLYPTLCHGVRDRRQVALTFDDGPDPEVTAEVLDVLAAAHVHATFFVIGRHLDGCPQLGRRMLAEGHVIGNHSWRHSRWQNFCSTAWHARELERGARAISALTRDSRPPLYRPPVGLKSGELARACAARGLTLVAWSLHSRDTFARDAKRVARRVLGKIRAGDIVLLHDGHDRAGRHRQLCVPALRLILQGLGERNLECVTVPELLGLPTAPTGAGACRSA